ncbi:hypothetical protein ABE073_04360 [Lederbergia citrisecunda]|uniref:hypothetical protein n=1 Tax=Lederbergia citrisecunda TaxID=2833583 RepID=UPI003D2D8884
MELFRIVTDNGVEIPITEENRQEFLSDPEAFKLKYEGRILEMRWEQYKESMKGLSPEELERVVDKARELYEEEMAKKEEESD